VDLFTARYLSEGSAPSPASTPPRADAASGEPTVGSDEAGKGDYLGPLVVVAFRLDAADAAALAEGGVMDSKKLTDETVHRLAPALQERFDCAIEVLDPPEYNREHRRCRNLNVMLADLHARAIRRLVGRGDHVVVDRFAREELVASRLADLDLRLEQFPRAERVPAVAAASVIARHAFLEGLHRLSERFAVNLRKGAGAPTDISAAEFVALHGIDALPEVAKVHFKNTAKLSGQEQGGG
jgi:ribonuclease HIII